MLKIYRNENLNLVDVLRGNLILRHLLQKISFYSMMIKRKVLQNFLKVIFITGGDSIVIKGVIFDMDGVIIESESIYMEAEKDFFKELGLEFTKKEREKYTGIPLDEIWKKIIEDYNLNFKYSINDLVEKHVEVFYQGLKEKDIQLMAGIEKWFEKLKEKNYKMIIASSSFPKIVNYIYQKFNLDNYMQGFINVKNIKDGKPNPEIFVKAAEKLDLIPKECLVIEDSMNGVLAAKKANMKCIAFNNRKDSLQNLEKADLVINKFNQKNFEKIFA